MKAILVTGGAGFIGSGFVRQWIREETSTVVVLDKRLLTKTYGPFFIDSLPDPTVHKGSLALLPKTATDWLSRQL